MTGILWLDLLLTCLYFGCMKLLSNWLLSIISFSFFAEIEAIRIGPRCFASSNYGLTYLSDSLCSGFEIGTFYRIELL